jgi:hypothetical protein
VARSPRDTDQETTPRRQPDVTPSYGGVIDTWQITEALMQIQASISALNVKTDRLISDVAEQGKKIDQLRIRFAWVAGGATVVGALIGIALTLIRFAR